MKIRQDRGHYAYRCVGLMVTTMMSPQTTRTEPNTVQKFAFSWRTKTLAVRIAR